MHRGPAVSSRPRSLLRRTLANRSVHTFDVHSDCNVAAEFDPISSRRHLLCLGGPAQRACDGQHSVRLRRYSCTSPVFAHQFVSAAPRQEFDAWQMRDSQVETSCIVLQIKGPISGIERAIPIVYGDESANQSDQRTTRFADSASLGEVDEAIFNSSRSLLGLTAMGNSTVIRSEFQNSGIEAIEQLFSG